MSSKTVLLLILLVMLPSTMLGARFTVLVGGAPGIIEVPTTEYPTIQAAVDAAESGDIIQVASGTYNECVTVDKQLTLVGEDSSTTIINSNGTYHVVYVTANYVHISGFTIQNGIFQHEPGNWSYFNGILLKNSRGSTISGNIIRNNFHGIFLERCSSTTISGNEITNNYYGIRLHSSGGNIVNDNTISGNTISKILFNGIHLCVHSCDNIISGNTISDNAKGVCLSSTCVDNTFYHNNLINNTNQACSEGSVNTWDDGYPSGGNYWSDYEERYPDAEELDGSGIWDTPYVIDEKNQDNYPLMEPWIPDVTPPTINILSPLNATYGTNFVDLTFTIDEPTSWIGYSLDNQQNSTIAGNITLTDLSEGAHHVIIYANDTSGNMGLSSRVYFTLNYIPPTTIIDFSGTPGLNGWYISDVQVTLTATDENSGVTVTEYSFENVTWTTYTLPFNITEEGTATVYYRSTDIAGNIEPTQFRIVKIDKTAPSGSVIISNGDAYTSSTSVTLTLTYGDATSGVSQVRYSNDGVWDTEPWESPSTTKPWILTAGDGTKTVYYQVRDNAGLVSPSYQDTIILDTTLPTVNAGQDQTVNVGTPVTFNASSSTDNIGIVSYEWDFGDGTTGTGITVNHTYANPGTYTVTLTVKDVAGNIDTDHLTVTVTVKEVFPWWIVGAAAAVIVIAVAVTILWRRRK